MSHAWLITGGSGFVGKALLARLAASEPRPATLRVLVRQPSDAPACFESSVGDLRDPHSLARACEGIDTVIHLAGIAHVGSAASAEAHAINHDGSLALLRAAIDAGARRFVFNASKNAADADTISDFNVTEDQILLDKLVFNDANALDLVSYNASTGALSYDGTTFATLNTGLDANAVKNAVFMV